MRRLLTIAASLAVAAAGAVMLAACSSAELASFTGTWSEGGQGGASLTIEEDGRFHGTDGCNNLVGQGTVSGEEFDFGDFGTTMKACPGMDPWLGGASTATISGETLTVFSEDDTEIGTLERE